MTDTPKEVFQKIVCLANRRGFLMSYSDKHTVEECLRTGEPIPDRLLPGRFLDELNEEERNLLKQITSDEAANTRPDAIFDSF